MISKITRVVIRCDDCRTVGLDKADVSILQSVWELRTRGWYASERTREALCPKCRKKRVSE